MIAAAAGLVYAALQLLDGRLGMRVAIGGLAGGLVGYLVLRDARKRQVEAIGQYGALASLIAGTLGGLLAAVPVALIFVFIIRRRARMNAGA